MTEPLPTIELLREHVFELIETSRDQLALGQVDLTPVEEAVRQYCQALSVLPLEEAQPHVPDLQHLSEQMTALEAELNKARIYVQRQLSELGNHHKAHKAYRKSDSIGEKFFAPEEDEE